jgi:hypothetical protein
MYYIEMFKIRSWFRRVEGVGRQRTRVFSSFSKLGYPSQAIFLQLLYDLDLSSLKSFQSREETAAYFLLCRLLINQLLTKNPSDCGSKSAESVRLTGSSFLLFISFYFFIYCILVIYYIIPLPSILYSLLLSG